ncbi:MAG: 23S rRNA (uracil(1939)-C(5))-methyltransferase RlmD, partial [Syntrophomonadaceae bacterium]|nr:23S rRNA (uracil(1939)-C(5))-methyltransferase RlmD [Syntrophomonadaceae bacterium]
MQARIEGISHRGEGVARINGKATFIPYAIPGEEVEVEIVQEHKRFARGKLARIYIASPDRREPVCPAYYDCGGCAYQHIDYARELDLKRNMVEETLKRLGGIEAEVLPVIGMEDPYRYRNKVVWHTAMVNGKIQMGFYREGSHDLIPLGGCTLIHEDMEQVQNSLAANLSDLEMQPGTEFSLRRSFWTGHMSLVLSGKCNNEALSAWASSLSTSLSLHVNQGSKINTLQGAPYIEEQLCGLTFRVSPLAFLQVNHQQTEKLYQLIHQYAALSGKETILDGFSGIGTIALSLAQHVSQVTGVELYPQAVTDAKQNAAINGIRNARFYVGPCEDIITRLNQSFDVVVLDPPRAGCKLQTIEAVVK